MCSRPTRSLRAILGPRSLQPTTRHAATTAYIIATRSGVAAPRLRRQGDPSPPVARLTASRTPTAMRPSMSIDMMAARMAVSLQRIARRAMAASTVAAASVMVAAVAHPHHSRTTALTTALSLRTRRGAVVAAGGGFRVISHQGRTRHRTSSACHTSRAASPTSHRVRARRARMLRAPTCEAATRVLHTLYRYLGIDWQNASSQAG